MKFELEEDYIELFKLIKVMGLVESGGQAKVFIEEGKVKRNGLVELRKRSKIVVGESIEIEGDTIEVLAVSR